MSVFWLKDYFRASNLPLAIACSIIDVILYIELYLYIFGPILLSYHNRPRKASVCSHPALRKSETLSV